MFPYMMPKIQYILDPTLEPNEYNKYIYPINGLMIIQNKKVNIGYVTFADRDYIINNFEVDLDLIDNCTVNTFAIVDIESQKLTDNYEQGYNAIALKILKEVIGYLNVLVYKAYGNKKERQIMITTIYEHIMDDGFTPYLCIDKSNRLHIKNYRINIDLDLNIHEISKFLNLSEWNKLFEIQFKKRTEFQSRILKSLEYLYYIFNEIYTSERLIKFFIILNHLLRKNDREDLNRKGISKLLNRLFNQIGKVKIIESKFNDVFEDLYIRMRNNILHGILDTTKEASIVEGKDYYLIKKIVLELIILLVENPQINCLSNGEGLYKLVDSYNKRRN